jgi:hypothetical protein
LGRLKGVKGPEKKRKIIGNTFIEVFQREAERVKRESGGDVDFLLQTQGAQEEVQEFVPLVGLRLNGDLYWCCWCVVRERR